MTERQFDPVHLLQRLTAHGVRFVLIGGLAGKAHGSPTLTVDLDICPADDRDNLERLAAALGELGATWRGAPHDAPFVPERQTIERNEVLTLVTDSGDLDVVRHPVGVMGFEELAANAVDAELADGLFVRVASLDDLIAMKRAAGRPKDRIELEVLGALREEIDRGD